MGNDSSNDVPTRVVTKGIERNIEILSVFIDYVQASERHKALHRLPERGIVTRYIKYSADHLPRHEERTTALMAGKNFSLFSLIFYRHRS